MSYEKKTIIATINDINDGKMFLPAIQRKFVWTNEDKITRLMDSIMCGYPIGTFLYWKVTGKIVNDGGYSLYKFVYDYTEMNGDNEAAPRPIIPEEKEVFAVLDGQQRLTSLCIALQGSLALHKKRGPKPANIPKKELYFNVKSVGVTPSDGDENEGDCRGPFKTLKTSNLTFCEH